MSIKIKQAELLARFVHFNQKRQDGEDYINHCERIAYQISLSESSTEDLICAAWLHDTIEDSTSSELIAHLIEETFGGEVYELVYILTHVKDKESYDEYITKVFEHPTAWQIKWLDMIDNTSYNIPEKQRNKYRDACLHLIKHGVTVPSILIKKLKL